MILRSGKHMPGGGEACAMEYLSWRDLKLWTDRPLVVTRIVAFAVHGINDMLLSSDERWRLVNVYGERIMGSRFVYDNAAHRAMCKAMHEWLKQESTRLSAHGSLTDDVWVRDDARMARDWLGPSCSEQQLANVAGLLARAWTSIGPKEAFAFLDLILAAYEKASSDAILERIALV